MNEEHPDGVTLIGLHKLAASNSDGLVPEHYDVFLRNAERQRRYPNVVDFPIWETRLPGQKPKKALGLEAANSKNVVAFPPALAGGKGKA